MPEHADGGMLHLAEHEEGQVEVKIMDPDEVTIWYCSTTAFAILLFTVGTHYTSLCCSPLKNRVVCSPLVRSTLLCTVGHSALWQ